MISVALCTRNGARFIDEQIASILSQSLPVDEIVVSDDASTDDTVERVIAAVERHSPAPSLRVLRNAQPLGVTGNFEQAIRETTGDVILLSDQDDVWMPDRVAASVAALGDDPRNLLVHGDARLVDQAGAPLGSTLFGAYGVDARTRAEIAGGGAFDLFMRRNLVTGATVAIRRELAQLAAPFPSAWVHDEWLAIVASVTGAIVPLDAVLIDYRQHDANEIGAASLGLRGRIARLTAPGRERNRVLLERALQLQQRFGQLGDVATDARTAQIAQKVHHEQVRSALSVHRLARIAPVLAEARTGRYSRFGGGAQDVLRDLVQPLG